MKSYLTAALAVIALIGIATPRQVEAVLLNYTFNGTAASSSTLDIGSGAVSVAGAAFTITGMTTSDVDLSLTDDGTGQFASMSTYNFGGIGSFVTDSSTDEFYVQDCNSPTAIICVGLVNLAFNEGFVAFFSPPVAGDPNAGGIPVGTGITPSGIEFGNPYVLTNLAGDTLTLNFAPDSISSFSVTAKSVPEPGAVGLLALGLLGLCFVRRRQTV